MKEVWFRNLNCKLHIYATYDFLQIALCARVCLIYTNPILMKIDIHLRYVIMHV